MASGFGRGTMRDILSFVGGFCAFWGFLMGAANGLEHRSKGQAFVMALLASILLGRFLRHRLAYGVGVACGVGSFLLLWLLFHDLPPDALA